ncbi:MAG: metalloregulator ArsR/SmtB family transcription factor [Ferroplasma sp.]|uniref:ArsR/SmtB family transcription factor n=1 Tax=Ferroplasma sp. TaxID=2591003 RepID=UPI002815461E|nr:metalloregulator ArsR/SmtB family transcription factor [Ferroplasma sp.]WMT50724.1 MAG: metalloregulator ArsR/SmtB family transcription factor [Ferroplasma sp.]
MPGFNNNNLQQNAKIRIDRLFYCLSSPIRLEIIRILSRGTKTVKGISELLNSPQPLVSGHLKILLEYGFVNELPFGREVFYKIIPEQVEFLTTYLDDMAGNHKISITTKNSKNNVSFSECRRCYDHLAGLTGVMLLKTLLSNNWLKQINDKPEYDLTDIGEINMIRLGVKIPAKKKHGRIFAYGCRDLTEKEFHLGGALGSALMKGLVVRGFISVHDDSRIVTVIKPVKYWFDI